MTTPATQLQRWTRDDWVIPCVVEDPSGTAINLTGFTIAAEYTISGYHVASDLTSSNGGIVDISAAAGQFSVVIPRVLTAKAPADAGCPPHGDSTRVLLYWIDTHLRRQTLGVIPFEVFNGRKNLAPDETLPVTIVWQDASFTIKVPSAQGPAGPSSIGAAQITDASAIGRQLLQAASAPAVRALLSLTGISRTPIDDVDCNVATTDVYVSYVALSAPRTVHLPPASTYPVGQGLTIADESGACASDQPLSIVADGADTIAGAPLVTMANAFQKLTFHSNGTNLWVF